MKESVSSAKAMYSEGETKVSQLQRCVPRGLAGKTSPVSPVAETLSPRHLPAAHRCPAPLAQLDEEVGNWAVLSEHFSKFLRKILIYKI